MSIEWNAAHYLRYGDERTRPSIDLAYRVRVADPRDVIDLGCGPGNSTQAFRARWPVANICGIDNSAAVIDSARGAFPDQKWLLADFAELPSELFEGGLQFR